MITFGAALEVRGTARGVWCYRPAPLGETSASYHGVSMTWKEWAQPIIQYLDDFRTGFSFAGYLPSEERSRIFSDTLNTCLMKLSYQDGKYMTLPGEQYKKLKEWVYQYLYDGPAAFPFAGSIPDGDYAFTIDFEKDIEIVRSYDLKTEMSQYNREHNSSHNKDMGRRQTEERFQNLCGDEWTTQEILGQGFSRKTLDKFVKYGLIRRVKQGHYVRNSV